MTGRIAVLVENRAGSTPRTRRASVEAGLKPPAPPVARMRASLRSLGQPGCHGIVRFHWRIAASASQRRFPAGLLPPRQPAPAQFWPFGRMGGFSGAFFGGVTGGRGVSSPPAPPLYLPLL